MPRYFFHVHLNGIVERDRVGLELGDLSEAISEAEQARRDIMREDAIVHLWLEVTDQDGCILAKIP
jgi:hypothetical protein